MAKFHGLIGFVATKEKEPGIWVEEKIEREYYGDVTRNVRKWIDSNQINSNINISNSISIVADSYAYENVYAMKYIHFGGAIWNINDIDIQRPRIILSIGGLYNG